MAKVRVENQEEYEEHQERVQEEMLDLIELLKSQGKEMEDQLRKDNVVIDNIATKQEKVSRSITKETASVKQLNN